MFNLLNRDCRGLLAGLCSCGLNTLLVSKNLLALDNVVGTAKQSINLLERDLLSLWNKEVYEDSQQEVDSGKHVECVEAAVVQEDREELLEDGVCDVLSLRSHTDSLSTNIHGKDFRCPNPNSGTP